MQDTPPIFFTALRFACAGCFVVFIPRPQIPLYKLLLMGVFLGGGMFALTFVAMTLGLSASLASVLVHVQAIFTILISMAVFGERMNRRQLLALLVAASGIVVLALEFGHAGSVAALVLILLAALSGGIGNNVMKSLGQADMLRVSVWMATIPPLPLFALSLVLEPQESLSALFATITWPTVVALIWSSVLATVPGLCDLGAIAGCLLISRSRTVLPSGAGVRSGLVCSGPWREPLDATDHWWTAGFRWSGTGALAVPQCAGDHCLKFPDQVTSPNWKTTTPASKDRRCHFSDVTCNQAAGLASGPLLPWASRRPRSAMNWSNSALSLARRS